MDFHFPINRSLVRPNLPLGVEKIPLALLVAPPAGIGFLMMSQRVWTYGAVLWVVGLIAYVVLRFMAKSDPYMFEIYFRSMKYRRMYAPRPTIHGKRVRKLWF